ncbi:hypothetical protein JMJ77_0007710 [Colletotrichum scovillei]|uniref:Uncharacterized protein n=1 Tax=Colletotrichum scovillei TaxID=1209932 RepID=A0A9P7RD13_9PEZI|nr:hypothetical protein JMJ77_0007710 [Colletotrichum scovillei]KAG7074690.1 hypothetical protein JMJ76_0011164 [Colletotrichum scovillei]KAG7081882.1 hypothetical protein JMJ78_0003994 [Colletotrichum scovillei]
MSNLHSYQSRRTLWEIECLSDHAGKQRAAGLNVIRQHNGCRFRSYSEARARVALGENVGKMDFWHSG